MRFFIAAGALAAALVLGASLAQGQTWNLQIVDDAGDAGYDSQIVTAQDGIPYIYYKKSSDLYVAWWVPGAGDTGGWQFQILDTNTVTAGYTFEVLIDSLGRFHLAYGKSYNGMRYGIWNPATKAWVLGPETITGGIQYAHVDLSLVTLGTDIVPVVCANTDNGKVYVYRRDPATGTWTNTQVDPIHNAYYASTVAVDSARNMHVAFYEYAGQNLMYATKAWDAATWQVSTVDVTGNIGSYCSIAVDPTDHIHIVYYDATNGDLKYAALNP